MSPKGTNKRLIIEDMVITFTSRRFYIENEKPTITQCLREYKHFTSYDGDIVSYISILINTRFIIINIVFHQILHEFKLMYPTLTAGTHIPKFNALMEGITRLDLLEKFEGDFHFDGLKYELVF